MITVSKLAELVVRDGKLQAEKRIKEERLVPYLNNFDNYRIFPYLKDSYVLCKEIESETLLYESVIRNQSDRSRVKNAHDVLFFLYDVLKDIIDVVIPVGETKRDELANKFAVSEPGYKRSAQNFGWLMVHNNCYQQANLNGHQVFCYQLGHVEHANPRYFYDMVTDRTSAVMPDMDPVAARQHLIDKNLITETGKFFVVHPKNNQQISHSLEHAIRGVAEYMIFQRVKCI